MKTFSSFVFVFLTVPAIEGFGQGRPVGLRVKHDA